MTPNSKLTIEGIVSSLGNNISSYCNTPKGLHHNVPYGKCFFCSKKKSQMFDFKIRTEDYDGVILGGVALKVHTFTYQVCLDCLLKLCLRGIAILLIASLVGGAIGLIFSYLIKLNIILITTTIKYLCIGTYAIAVLSFFYTYMQIRLHILWFFAAVLFALSSCWVILYLYSFSLTLCICFIMALSIPTIIFGFRKKINLFTKLHNRSIY